MCYCRAMLRRARAWMLPIAGASAFLLAACGGSDDSGVAPGAPEGVSDEEYLAVLCAGAESFSDALIAQSTPDGLRAAIQAYIDALEAVTPPRDVSKWHVDYIAFLKDAESQPSLMVSGNPPIPAEPARSRLAQKESDVAECEDPLFFSPAATPTPRP